MSIAMFGIGFLIFVIYVVFLVWNIVYNGNKQEKENEEADNLIKERRALKGKVGDAELIKHERKRLRKLISKKIRQDRKKKGKNKIKEIIEEFKDLKRMQM